MVFLRAKSDAAGVKVYDFYTRVCVNFIQSAVGHQKNDGAVGHLSYLCGTIKTNGDNQNKC